MKNFIKVVDRDIANKLVSLDFQYIKEGSDFVFIQTEELMAVLQQSYFGAEIIIENKLRF